MLATVEELQRPTANQSRGLRSIVEALPWRRSAEVLDVLGDVTDDDREKAYDLGGTLAALLLD